MNKVCSATGGLGGAHMVFVRFLFAGGIIRPELKHRRSQISRTLSEVDESKRAAMAAGVEHFVWFPLEPVISKGKCVLVDRFDRNAEVTDHGRQSGISLTIGWYAIKHVRFGNAYTPKKKVDDSCPGPACKTGHRITGQYDTHDYGCSYRGSLNTFLCADRQSPEDGRTEMT
ncbi:hypothetical protein B0H16DRAFT_565366 [Mycena metata]|uniref:Uncharacterized protein n=1 Tax=Mycena metata TaxID=1033252 RepID=A0AAD7H513_9AGAR|nr:hypothetical protein B0H16DRAFT_565366 [Mycena metata]